MKGRDPNDILRHEGADALRAASDNAKPYQPIEPVTPRPEGNGGQQSGRSGGPKIMLVPFNAVKLGTARRYLVKDIIPRSGLAVAWGPPKCGKSFWVFDLLMHVALGWQYRGRRVQQGAVVYCAFEGQTGIEARVEAFRQNSLANTEHADVPFYIEPVTLNLVREHRALIAAIKQQLGTTVPVAVALDTLNRSFQGSESSDEDMTAYVTAADAIREAFDCAVLIVHHCGIEGTRPRGHTSLTGAVAAQLSVQRSEDGTVAVTVEYMKDGNQGDVLAFRLDRVVVGTDEDGEEISSCVVVPLDGEETTRSKQPKLSPQLELARRVLVDLVADQGKSPPATWGLPTDIKIIATEDWLQALVNRGEIQKENSRRLFWNMKSKLKVRGVVGERDGSVWWSKA